jgi:3-dehydroquinate synthase
MEVFYRHRLSSDGMKLSCHSTEIHIGPAARLPDLCEKFGQRAVLIADEALKVHAKPLAESLHAELICIPSGEKAKTREVKQRIEDQLLGGGYGRDTVIVSLGGGATSDVVGFAASTYLRGVPLILVPTTLLAMVDAAIGGKTGINTRWGKNLIGTLYHPKAVICDLSFLETLSETERLNGMAEILKMGLVADAEMFNRTHLEELVIRAIQGKIAIVEKDPHEGGLRRILNFGHTIGHALEAVSRYEMPHGSAVAIGCMAASHLSMVLGYLSALDFSRACALFDIFPHLRLPKGYTREHCLKAMASDKKKAGNAIRFVLIDALGHAAPFDGAYCRSVSPDELQETLDWMEERF